MNQTIVGFLLNQAIAGIWEVFAVSKLFQLKNCEFTIAYFNLIFYSGYMMHSLFSWLAAPFVLLNLYRRITKDTFQINQKIS